MRNGLLIPVFLAALGGGFLDSASGRADPPAASASRAVVTPATPPAAQPTIRYALTWGKLNRITHLPAQTINSVRQQDDDRWENVPGAVVVSRRITVDGHTYQIDHSDAQIISGEVIPALDAASELLPDPPGTEKAPEEGQCFKSFADQGPPPTDVIVGGIKVTARIQSVWLCANPVGVVGGLKVRDSEATPWQAEIFSDAQYTHQDFKTDAGLVRTRSSDAEYLNQRHAYEYRHHCDAVLIADDWLLTAQHCITNGDGRIDPAYFIKWRRIRIGTHDLTEGGTTAAIDRVVLHPHFNEAHYRNDIALIHIVADARTDQSIDEHLVAPIRIQGTWPDDPKAPDGFKALTVYGWGTQTERKDGDAPHLDDNGHVIHEARGLRRVNLDYVPRARCARHPDYRGDITPGVICVGYAPGGRDSCQGDSGGPLVGVFADRDKPKLLVGIVSGGVGCALRNTPGIYTYVPHYLPWIRSIVGDAPLRSQRLN